MDFVTLKTFDNPIDAHLLKSRLENDGIDCFLLNEHMVSLNPMLSNALNGIELKINKKDIDQSLKILSEINQVGNTNSDNEAILCPKCGSSNVFSNFNSFKSFKGIISLIISFLFFIFPMYVKKVYKCKNCFNEFEH